MASRHLEVALGSGPFRPIEALSRPGRQALPGAAGSAPQWQELRRSLETGKSGLWRIHGRLYDLEAFLDAHPGGRAWLELTRGTDATEAFEAHHFEGAAGALERYQVGVVKEGEFGHGDRFTYAEEGFWRTLRRRAGKVLRNEGRGATLSMKAACLVCVLQFLAAHVVARQQASIAAAAPWAALAGFFMTGLFGVGHNFVHQREQRASWWRFAADLMGASSWDLRVTHVLSHHMHTNLETDWEAKFKLTDNGDFIYKSETNFVGQHLEADHVQNLYSTLITAVLRVFCEAWRQGGNYRWERALAPALQWVLVASYSVGHGSFAAGIALYSVQYLTWRLFYLPFASGVHHATEKAGNGAHGTLAWHEGQPGAEADFGAHQVISTNDHTPIPLWVPLFLRHWLSLSLFAYLNDHTLHHLFPAVDHCHLWRLHEVLAETKRDFCLDAGVQGGMAATAEVWWGWQDFVRRRRVREVCKLAD